MRPQAVLETVLYADDLAAARSFYEGVLGLECFAQSEDRHVFFRCGGQVLLLFNPSRTEVAVEVKPGVPPAHGARGPGHVCFSASDAEITRWRRHLEARGIAIEADFEWPRGGRSIYFRDPAGNCLEFGEPAIWGLPRAARTLRGQTVVIATHNKGKLEEFVQLLSPHGVMAVAAGDMGVSEPAETETTFEGNARIKAVNACAATGLPAIADDSGLCVAALDGAPGVYTADWAGPDRDFSRAMRLVEEKLQAKGATAPDQRRASFLCTLCVRWPDGGERLYVGEAPGHLVWPPRGKLGHGYDPVFMPDGETKTFAEMDHAHKNRLSHRGRALSQLLDDLF
jgi:XTP/dITP diphosphohydrolase